MKIEIKSIKINKAFSEETICFKADVYVNGVKTAYASNDGHGGCTFYNRYEGKEALLEQAEAFAKTLPSHFYKGLGEPMEIKSTLEGIIDQAIDDKFNEGEKAKANKKLAKDFETSICFGVPNGNSYSRIGYGKHPLKAVCLKQLSTVQALVDRIRRDECKNGVVILNTNLSELGLK